jgi:hypothetical protein
MWRRMTWRFAWTWAAIVVMAVGATGVRAADKSAPRLMSAEKDRQLRALFPRVNRPEIQQLLDDPRLLLYTEEEMPRAYQDWDGALPGVHSATYNISANGSEPFGNGNREFPWGHAGGTHRTSGVSEIRFLWLPLDEDGKVRPVTWYRKRLRGDVSTGYAWTFPVGAVLGELLLMDRPDGGRVAFELRLRTREEQEWDVDVFRPFPRAQYLADRIAELRPEWEANENLSQFMLHLTEPRELPLKRLYSRHPAKTVFTQRMGVDDLPPLEDQGLITELLTTTPFQSAAGDNWFEGPGGERTLAPTTDASYHIIPAKYDGGFIDVDRISCMRCHDSVNQHVRDFEPSRDWYGRVRGSDGIFSFHPFDPGTISWNGFSRHPSMRPKLADAGWIAPYDSDRHPLPHYQRIRRLDE